MRKQLSELRDKSRKEAIDDVLKEAVKAYKWAVICRASTNEDVASLAPHYEAIGEVWERHAQRFMEHTPATSKLEPVTPPQSPERTEG